MTETKYNFDPFDVNDKNIQEIAAILAGFLSANSSGADTSEEEESEDEDESFGVK